MAVEVSVASEMTYDLVKPLADEEVIKYLENWQEICTNKGVVPRNPLLGGKIESSGNYGKPENKRQY